MDEHIPKARWTRCQPGRGLFGFVITFSIAMIITYSCKIDSYLGLLSVWIMSMVPLQLVVGIGWGAQYPVTQPLLQPFRGIALTIFVAIFGTLACFANINFLSGGEIHPYTSAIVICSVVATVVGVVSFGTWPFNKLSTPARGFLTLAAVYLVVYLGINLFNFSQLSFVPGLPGPVPFYAAGGPLASFAHLVPKGPVPWETGLTFWLWIAFLNFTLVMLDFWPLNRFPKLMAQPVMGFVAFTLTALMSLLVYQVGVKGLKMEPLRLMYCGVSYAFGLLVVLVLFQKWPGRLIHGLAGSFLNIMIAVVIAFIGYHGVGAICRAHFGDLHYPQNIFAMATFMLGLNFPLWVAYADFWELWPLPDNKSLS